MTIILNELDFYENLNVLCTQISTQKMMEMMTFNGIIELAYYKLGMCSILA